MDESRAELASRIKGISPGDEAISTSLSTSEQVLRRVTDGIYREPWSALRELISNAYDADATTVIIQTDAPRFESIVIRDDGLGFTSETLARMIKEIGGSTKRVEEKRLGYHIRGTLCPKLDLEHHSQD